VKNQGCPSRSRETLIRYLGPSEAYFGLAIRIAGSTSSLQPRLQEKQRLLPGAPR